MLNRLVVAVAMLMALCIALQGASGIKMSAVAGDGTGAETGVSSDLVLDSEDRLVRMMVISPGEGISAQTSGQFMTGNGSLNETHSVSNADGDSAMVSAYLNDSDSWTYMYNLIMNPDYVAARENVDVVRGTGLEFRGTANNSDGDYAEVSAVGGEDCPVSMGYFNSLYASGSEVSGFQNVMGAVVPGSDEGCTEPLIISGFAGANRAGGTSAGVEAEVMGASNVNSFITVGRDDDGDRASQTFTANDFDHARTAGFAGQVVQGIIGASVEAESYNGTRFFSLTRSGFSNGTDGTATAFQRVVAEGDTIRKYTEAMGGLNARASINATVTNGTMITTDNATGAWNTSEVTETMFTTGLVSRNASARFANQGDPEFKMAEAGFGVDGIISGRSRAYADPSIASVRGNWTRIDTTGLVGFRSAAAENATNQTGAVQILSGTLQFDEIAEATNTTLIAE